MDLELSDSKLARDQPGFFSLARLDVSDKCCLFVCGQLICSCKANPANSSFLALGEFVTERWQLPKEQVIPLMTYHDEEGDECILNQKSIVDALAGTSQEKIWFQVYLSWEDRNMVWEVRKTDDGVVRRAIVRAYFVVFTLTTLALLRAQLTDSTWHVANLLNLLLFGALAGFYGWFYWFNPPPVFEGLGKGEI
ncbi:unnamed protein product [Polarella glacialis]|uniref:Uncharacterized protein n=1 Tax=Polarella glacialis TaxID=89957 RepID=A0A813GTW5_POLGL|nr:unnamed protein product [Polarella glacialis]